MRRYRARLSRYTALFRTYRALFQTYRALLNRCSTHISFGNVICPTRSLWKTGVCACLMRRYRARLALLSGYRVFLSRYRALLHRYRALFRMYGELMENWCIHVCYEEI